MFKNLKNIFSILRDFYFAFFRFLFCFGSQIRKCSGFTTGPALIDHPGRFNRPNIFGANNLSALYYISSRLEFLSFLSNKLSTSLSSRFKTEDNIDHEIQTTYSNSRNTRTKYEEYG